MREEIEVTAIFPGNKDDFLEIKLAQAFNSPMGLRALQSALERGQVTATLIIQDTTEQVIVLAPTKFEQLITESYDLEEIASQIQRADGTPGLTKAEIKQFTLAYYNWYGRAYFSLSTEKAWESFNHELTKAMGGIDKFLENPTKRHALLGWNFSFENYFKAPLANQRRILAESGSILK